MTFRNRVFIGGGCTTPFLGKGHPNFVWKKHPDFGKRENPGLREMLVSAVNGALVDTPGVTVPLIDRIYVANFAGELFCNQGHLGSSIAGVHPDFMYKRSMRVEGACASGGLAVASACDALQTGNCDVALVVGVEQQTTASARDGGRYLATAADFARQSGLDDFTFPCLLARRAKAYIDKYGEKQATMEALGKISAKAYGNGNKNPKAHMHAVKVSFDKAKQADDDKNPCFLSNEEYKPYMRMTDCSQVSDGASAIILMNEAGMEKCGVKTDKCAEIVGLDYGVGNLFEDAKDLAVMDTATTVINRLYENTGVKIGDVNVAEVHDCFSVAELQMYEAMGLAPQGKGMSVINDGVSTLEGSLPVNTGGGLISFGHPVGATGVKQVHEIYRQMKGQCGDYQLKSIPTHGLTVNMGGDDKTIVASVIRNL